MKTSAANQSRWQSIAIFFVFLAIAVVSYKLLPRRSAPIVVSPSATPSPLASPALPADPKLIIGTFSGKLPCADCSGLQTDLTLTRDSIDSAEGTFVLKENYLGKSPTPLITTGNWTTLRGTPKDKNATVYQLLPDDPERTSYYLKVGEDKLRILDNDRNTIDAPFDMTLKRIEAKK